jgi:CRP-like cAMP-binding protein
MPRYKLSPDSYRKLHTAARPIRKRKGTVLFRAGQPGRGAYLVRRGQVRMSLGDNPLLYPSRMVGAGSVIGLPATFSGEPYSLTAEAARDCQLEFIPRRRLLELLRQSPKVGFQIVRILSEEISEMRHIDVKRILVPDWTAQ